MCNKYGAEPLPPLKAKETIYDQYCSVYEFSGKERDTAYIPSWMLKNLRIKSGQQVELLSRIDLAKGEYCRLEPSNMEFLDMIAKEGPREVLEVSMKAFSALSEGERLLIKADNKVWQLVVKECRPDTKISILGDLDLEVVFDEPGTGSIGKSDAPPGTMKGPKLFIARIRHRTRSEYGTDDS